jgi:hypothetical protein
VRLTRDPSEASGPVFGTDLTKQFDATEQAYLAPRPSASRSPTAWRWTCSTSLPSRSCCWPGSPPSPTNTEREPILALHQGLALDAVADGARAHGRQVRLRPLGRDERHSRAVLRVTGHMKWVVFCYGWEDNLACQHREEAG